MWKKCSYCQAGVQVIGCQVRACTHCNRFESDLDAQLAVVEVLAILDEYGKAAEECTVADALDGLEEAAQAKARAA